MAKLKAHGKTVAEKWIGDTLYRLMEDGAVLRCLHFTDSFTGRRVSDGWKLAPFRCGRPLSAGMRFVFDAYMKKLGGA